MPEKPEVVTVCNNLKKLVIGKTITDCNVFWDNIIVYPKSDEFIKKIINQKIMDINTRGKWILFTLTNDCLLVHLRMEGKFMFRNKGDKIGYHEHVEFILDDSVSFRFHDVRKFGKMHLLPKERAYNLYPLNELGYEYYDSNLTKEYLFDSIKKKRLPIKTLLLDQSIIAGIGNIYDDEILFMSGISPLRRGCDVTLSECQKIIDNNVIVMEKAIKLGGTTIKSFTSSEGVHGRFQNELLVHGKDNCKCPKCGADIIKIRVNGRGTYYCENCQK